MDLNYRKKLIVRPESKVRLADFDPAFTGKHESQETALPEIEQYRQKLGSFNICCTPSASTRC